MKDHPERYDYYQRELLKAGQQLDFFRKQAYLYLERPSTYNLAVLGEDFIRRMKRELPPLVFATSIMCKRFNIMMDGFYNALREDVNLYVAPNRSRLSLSELGEGKVYENDCRNDGDLMPDAPIMIALDVNNNINWLVCGQVGTDGKLRVLKSFYVTYERKLDAVLDDFCDYYQYHREKYVIFFFDHTFKGNGYAINQNDDFYIFIGNTLRDHGWYVEEVYIGRAMNHVDKAILINRMLAGRAAHQVLINQDNNEALLLSIETAGVHNGQKDKRAEKEPETETDPLFARTDGSDAFDTLCIGVERFLPSDYMGSYSGFTSYFGG
jgi:hypothetical protein